MWGTYNELSRGCGKLCAIRTETRLQGWRCGGEHKRVWEETGHAVSDPTANLQRLLKADSRTGFLHQPNRLFYGRCFMVQNS